MCAKKDPVCPNCRFRVDDIPKDLHKEEDAEKKVEKYLNILNQKLLLKMLFKQIIFHACPMELKDALIKATNLYTKNIREVKIKVLAEKRANQETFDKLSHLENFYKKQKEFQDMQKAQIKKEKENNIQLNLQKEANLKQEVEIAEQ